MLTKNFHDKVYIGAKRSQPDTLPVIYEHIANMLNIEPTKRLEVDYIIDNYGLW